MKYSSDRLSDLARRKHGRCYLVKQRLKDMLALAVDQRDVDRLVRQGLRRPKAAETGTDYDYFWFAFHMARGPLTSSGPNIPSVDRSSFCDIVRAFYDRAPVGKNRDLFAVG